MMIPLILIGAGLLVALLLAKPIWVRALCLIGGLYSQSGLPPSSAAFQGSTHKTIAKSKTDITGKSLAKSKDCWQTSG
ncbi:hypothetical protein DDZ13_02980 [Coraliomargarita sinensis]|uniref:Uncharacterized protein n=1 Tax=Coraliomargarita sinensis TaxID=2174842 RepID=A0A317ZH27_9BACT|nr:hypothetical protein DDZ13_02980 [Coraliomargarita sinensis]